MQTRALVEHQLSTTTFFKDVSTMLLFKCVSTTKLLKYVSTTKPSNFLIIFSQRFESWQDCTPQLFCGRIWTFVCFTNLKVDEGEWKWMKVDKMDENGWRWRKVLLNWDYGFLCFSSAVWLSIIICYESASLGSILFLWEEKSNRYKLFLHE